MCFGRQNVLSGERLPRLRRDERDAFPMVASVPFPFAIFPSLSRGIYR
jgi:hypothetical protein